MECAALSLSSPMDYWAMCLQGTSLQTITETTFGTCIRRSGGQSSDPDSLVSVGSVLITKEVTTPPRPRSRSGQLAHMPHPYGSQALLPYNCRSETVKTFSGCLENTLGITGEPKWYPCYFIRLCVINIVVCHF